MTTQQNIELDHRREAAMPRRLKIALLGVLSLAVGGAAWLIWSRGTAILVDLGSAAAGLFCF